MFRRCRGSSAFLYTLQKLKVIHSTELNGVFEMEALGKCAVGFEAVQQAFASFFDDSDERARACRDPRFFQSRYVPQKHGQPLWVEIPPAVNAAL